jgi:hypothetical protein
VLLVDLPGQLKAIQAAPSEVHIRDDSLDVETGSEHLKRFFSRTNGYDPEAVALQHGSKGEASQNLILHEKNPGLRTGVSRRE